MVKEDLYAVLGCPSTATTDQILSEYKARVRQFHPDKQTGRDDQFCQLQYAKDVLTDPSKRRHYDTYMNMGMQMPLKEWMAHRESLQQTLHWANTSAPTPAIEPQEKREQNDKPIDWKRHQNSTLDAFRNYRL
ncbi:unnamed protein product [Bursaphelenchus okinawaensis]|uniref:J domain-containing protein n=1 Tax=Bursaphelenchus okinawaensis TaxID=465554 RepID=A0A811KIV1_9BILA|nr:unnamed protein product [Bursaphelenchus okinawaensis]CAG9103536.1 unnamed protein product [Bursaphelenchus okinawaensis]